MIPFGFVALAVIMFALGQLVLNAFHDQNGARTLGSVLSMIGFILVVIMLTQRIALT